MPESELFSLAVASSEGKSHSLEWAATFSPRDLDSKSAGDGVVKNIYI